MPARPWYDWNPGAYALDTAHLDDDQDLLYRRLLDVHWRDESLPDDPARIRTLARAAHWDDERFDRAWSEVSQYFTRKRGRLVQKRMRARIDSVLRDIERKRRAGKARWNKTLQADAEQVQSECSAPCSLDRDPEQDQDLNPDPSSVGFSPAPKQAKSSPRGSRWTADAVPDEWKSWAMITEDLDDRRVERIAESFVDYWRAVAGAKGLKRDWQATWRNWVRREIDGNGRANGNALHAETPHERVHRLNRD